MKLALFKVSQFSDDVYFENVLYHDKHYLNKVNFIGFVDLPIEKPKKLVTKESPPNGRTAPFDTDLYFYEFRIPKTAKNVRCTYEIEE